MNVVKRATMRSSLLAKKLIAVITVVMSMLLTAAPAFADDPVPAPPVRSTIDDNGVDLTSGQLLLGRTDVSIGPEDHHGLQFRRQWVTNGWSYADVPVISGSTSYPVVTWRGKSVSFKTDSSGYYVPYFEDGSRLNYDRTYFRASDGTEIWFSNAAVNYSQDASLGYATKIDYPDSAEWLFDYDDNTFTTTSGEVTYIRLASIRSSTGFQIKFSYQSDTLGQASVTAWQAMTKATALNNAVEYCAPTGGSCTFANTWPEASYGTNTYTDPEGRTTTYTYTSGKLTGIKPAGAASNLVTFGYTSSKVSSVQKYGQTWSYSYGASSTTATNPGTNTRVVAYNTDKGVTSDTNEAGKVTTFSYCVSTDTNCPVGLPKKVTAPEGNYLTLTYDTRGNVTSRTFVAKSGSGLANISTSATYPTTCTDTLICNQPESTTDARGQVTNYAYENSNGFLTKVLYPADSNGVRPEVHYSYTASLARYLTAPGVWANSGYNYVHTGELRCFSGDYATCHDTVAERVIRLTYPDSSVPNNGQPTTVTVRSGDSTLVSTSTITYNNFGQVLTVDGPLSGTGDTTRMRYSAHGEPEGKIGPDPDGSGTAKLPAIKYTYNAWGQPYLVQSGTVTGLTDSNWSAFSEVARSTTEYDSYGRAVREKVGNGSTVTQVQDTVYDTMNRVSCTVLRMDSSNWGASAATSCTPPQTTGSNGADRVTKNTYDALSRVTKVTSGYGTTAAADDATVTFTNNGRIATATDGANNKTTYEYDGHDRLVKTRYPSATKGAGSSSTTDYEQVSYDENGNIKTFQTRRGETLNLTYDNLNRLIVKDVPTRSGLSTTFTQDVYFGYDLLGNMTYAKFANATTGLGITNTYDGLGRLATSKSTVTNYPGTKLSYQYDEAGNLTRLTHVDGININYNRSTTGTLSTIDVDGSSLIGLDLDSAGRVSAVKRWNTSTSSWAQSSSASYDALSRVTSLSHDPASTSQDVATTFTYNPVSQIKTALRNNDLYAWNGAVNATRTYTSNGRNQYTAAATASFSYDSNGNLTSDGTNTYVYDVENRLITRSGGASATLRYDPLGRLYEVAGTTTTRLLYSGNDLIAEYDASGSMLRRYVQGVSEGDDPLVWFEGSDVSDAARRYLYADERGSIIAVTDSVGAVVSNGVNGYDEYGIPGSANSGRYQYTGQMWFAELGMYYYKARMYSPTLGRFMQADPIGYRDGMNIYAYVKNDPLNWVDPTGLSQVECGTYYYDNNYNGILDDGDTTVEIVVCAGGSGNYLSPGYFGPGPTLDTGVVGGSGGVGATADTNSLCVTGAGKLANAVDKAGTAHDAMEDIAEVGGGGKYLKPLGVAGDVVSSAATATDSAAKGETMDVTFARVTLPLIGGIVGGAIGGAAGSLAGPFGTGAGAFALGTAGAAAGEWLADKIADESPRIRGCNNGQ